MGEAAGAGGEVAVGMAGSTWAAGCGDGKTGGIDSREKVIAGTGREAGLGHAVAERTRRYSQRVLVLPPPHPPIRLHAPGS